jgi:hypothetical protein
MTKCYIKVRTTFEALHQWPEAPPSVSFLAHPHRHMFVVHATVSVRHGNRDVEFFTLKELIDQAVGWIMEKRGTRDVTLGLYLITQSCEDMALFIGNYLNQYGCIVKQVEVSEDGENSGIVEFL